LKSVLRFDFRFFFKQQRKERIFRRKKKELKSFNHPHQMFHLFTNSTRFRLNRKLNRLFWLAETKWDDPIHKHGLAMQNVARFRIRFKTQLNRVWKLWRVNFYFCYFVQNNQFYLNGRLFRIQAHVCHDRHTAI
jgi:hypothetical protein